MVKSKNIRLLKGMMHIKLIVKIVGANQTFSGKLNSCAMSTSIFLKMAGRLMCAVIVLLLLANSLAAMLSAPKLFIITLIKAYEEFIITTCQRSLNAILSFIVFAKIRKNFVEALTNVLKRSINAMNSVSGNAI